MLVEIVLFVIMRVTNLNTSPYSATRGHLLIPICAAQTNLLKKKLCQTKSSRYIYLSEPTS